MNRNRAIPVLKKLFSTFSRTDPPVEQLNVYLDWADKFTEEIVTRTIEEGIEIWTKMPMPADLYAKARRIRGRKQQESSNREMCWYCDSIGWIPALFYKVNDRFPILRNLACKCSYGELHQYFTRADGQKIPIPKYFNLFPEPQFIQYREKYPDMTYPQIFNHIRNELIQEFHSKKNESI